MASVGIGMGHLHIQVHEQNHPRGSEITGTLELEGGIAVQHVRWITLKLVGFRPSGKTTELKEHASLVVARAVDLLPHSRQSFSFKFDIPDEAWLTNPPTSSHPTTGCRVDADADISFAVNPRCSIPLRVTVHREIQAVHLAMKKLGFKEKRSAFMTLTAPRPNQVLRHYHPPDSLLTQLDQAILTLQVDGERIFGELDLDPKEESLRDKMRALLVTQLQVFPLEYERLPLLTPDGMPNLEAALPSLHEILSESLVMPDNEKMRLLRPATTPAGDTLLRPATSARTKRDELLRPVDKGQ